MKKYYNLVQSDKVLDLYIYGDITSFPWCEGDVSAVALVDQIRDADVDSVNVYISSYGGEVQTGLAIYNALKRHKAKVTTHCDGFACSIASVIFMAGDERIMNDSSLLMIHNAWTFVEGNAQELRKQADDLEKITQASVVAYKAHSTLSEDEIKALMDAESWILPEEAMEYGFATAIETTENAHASQNAKKKVLELIKQHRSEEAEDETAEDETEDTSGEEDETPEVDTEDETLEDEPEVENPEDEETSEEEETEEEKTAQRWSGFFNALIKI